MPNDQEQQKLDQLAQRIESARRENEHLESSSPVGPEEPGESRNVGYDLLATVLGCILLGWLIDTVRGTGHIGLIGAIPVGFIIAIFQVWRSLNRNTDSSSGGKS